MTSFGSTLLVDLRNARLALLGLWLIFNLLGCKLDDFSRDAHYRHKL